MFVEEKKDSPVLCPSITDSDETGFGRVSLPTFDTDEALRQAKSDSDFVTVSANGDDDGMRGGAPCRDFVERLVKLMARRNRSGQLFF
jgi:hypothetical protein